MILIPRSNPAHNKKDLRKDILEKAFPNLSDPNKFVPEFKPVGAIGAEIQNLDTESYESLGPPPPFGHRAGKGGTTKFMESDPSK